MTADDKTTEKKAAEKKDCPVRGRLCAIGCRLVSIGACKVRLTEKYVLPLALLWARVHMALIFWRSGQTKIANLDTAVTLFEYEYLPKWAENSKDVFGLDLSWTLPKAEIAAPLSAYAELGLPVLLALGLAGRVSAFGLIVMTATIELFIYPGTTEHYHWMTILFLLMATGPGKISIDHFIRQKLMGEDGARCP